MDTFDRVLVVVIGLFISAAIAIFVYEVFIKTKPEKGKSTRNRDRPRSVVNITDRSETNFHSHHDKCPGESREKGSWWDSFGDDGDSGGGDE